MSDPYEIPEHVRKAIEESGASSTFTANDGSEWLTCDRCERWIPAHIAQSVSAEEDEIGYVRGFPVRGEGTVIVCPECATKRYDVEVEE